MPKKGQYVDRTGERYGRLVAISCTIMKNKYGGTRAVWLCRCNCGKVLEVPAINLCRSQLKSSSCGCKRLEGRKRERSYKFIRLQRIHSSFIKRCQDTKDLAFNRYGGRGITVDKDWTLPDIGFYNFYLWSSSNGYDENKTLDRIDNDGPYAPWNCRWATVKEQARNKRNTVLVKYDGRSVPLTEVCEKLGISPDLVRGRLRSGWELGRAINTPSLQSGTRKHKTYNRLRGIYNGVLQRCYRAECQAYKNYGGRGVSVCELWRKSYEDFETWALENGYSEHLTLDRIDVNGNYCPENCRWVTKSDQAKNKRGTVYVIYKGTRISALELYDLKSPPCGYKVFLSRLRKGWELDRALTQPQQGRQYNV